MQLGLKIFVVYYYIINTSTYKCANLRLEFLCKKADRLSLLARVSHAIATHQPQQALSPTHYICFQSHIVRFNIYAITIWDNILWSREPLVKILPVAVYYKLKLIDTSQQAWSPDMIAEKNIFNIVNFRNIIWFQITAGLATKWMEKRSILTHMKPNTIHRSCTYFSHI